MATAPVITPPVEVPGEIKLTISDGLSATLQEGFKMGQKLCDLGMSPEGQRTIEYWRQENVAFNATIASGWKAVTTWAADLFNQ